MNSSYSRSEVIQQIRAAYADVDLVLLCIQMPARFEDHDDQSQIIKLLEESLGSGMWKKTVVSLVFAKDSYFDEDSVANPSSWKKTVD